MAYGSQSRGLNSVRCFLEPVLLPARRSPPGGDAQRIQDPDSSRLPGKQRLPRGCVRHFQVLCSSETTRLRRSLPASQKWRLAAATATRPALSCW